MTDLYLRAVDEKSMDEALTKAGITIDGEPVPGVSLDRIGSFSKITGYDEKGNPIVKDYPEYHCNVRINFLSEEAMKLLEPLAIVPPEVPYRKFA